MTDTALIAWLESGAKVELTDDAAAARRASEFSARFANALALTDLGETEELHQAELARQVVAIHMELNALGELEYSTVWSQLSAPVRRAIKAYVSMGRENQ